MAGTSKEVAQNEVGGLGKILVIQGLVNHVMMFEICPRCNGTSVEVLSRLI